MSKKPVALIILDGFGYTPADKGNAVKYAKTPNVDKYMEMYYFFRYYAIQSTK